MERQFEYQLVGGPGNWGTATANTDGHFTFDPLADTYGECVYLGATCGGGAKSSQSQTRPTSWVLIKLNAPNGGFVPDNQGTDVTRIDIKQFTPVGIVNYNVSDNIQVYPTATDNNIFVETKVNTNVRIYSLDGRFILSNECRIGNTEINVSFLPTGNYIMHIIDNKNNVYFIKFTKK
jgi:hypothetical protein